MHTARRLLYGCLGLILILPAGAVGFITATGGTQYPLLWIIPVIACVAGIVMLAALWRLDWFSQSVGSEVLADWIDQISVSADQLPTLDDAMNRQSPRLFASIRNLIAQVHDYRNKLLVRHQRVQRLLRNVTDVLYHADRNGRLTWVSDSVTDMLGYTPEELRGYPVATLLVDPDTDLPILNQNVKTVRHPTRVYRRDGSVAWLLISSRRINDPEGRATGSEGICRDGTRLIATQRELNQEKERAHVTLAAIGDGVITTDAHGTIDYVNPRGQHMLSRRLKQTHGQALESVCHLYDSERRERIDGLVDECLKSGVSREWANALALVTGDEAPDWDRKDYRSVTVTVSAIRNEDAQIIGAVVVLHDVTRLERVSSELNHQANHDPLTGLLNRRAFERHLHDLLETSRQDNTQHTLCYLDLDQFKLINDSCGHHAGDAMLRQLSSQMMTQLRPADTLARLGGDEFGVIFEQTDLETAQAAADRLRQWVERFRFRWEDKVFRLGASFGLTTVGENSASAAELLRRADTACYLAKENGRNQIRIYHRDSDEARMRDYDIERMQLINEALDKDGFVLYGQPMFPLPNSENMPAGLELLLRMKNGSNQISTQNVLLTAERYSVASRIDRWVIEHALQLIRRYDGDMTQIGCYSINISGQSITDEQFIGFVRECIDRSGVDPSRLVFEITETAAVTNLQRAAELMRSLRTMGCRFALDDFGSGVSSFSYLKHLPSDFVKIDGKLVRHLTEDPVEHSIIKALNTVSQAMGLYTVAEHVETKEQFEALDRIGINYVQGYYVEEPMPLERLVSQVNNTA